MRIVAALAVAVVAAGCGDVGVDASGPQGWVAGVALGGRPVCPTPTGAALLCHTTPLARAIVIVAGPGGQRRVRADDHGRFRLALAPGSYSVHAVGAAAVRVRVVAGRVARMQLPAPRAGSDTGTGR